MSFDTVVRDFFYLLKKTVLNDPYNPYDATICTNQASVYALNLVFLLQKKHIHILWSKLLHTKHILQFLFKQS